MILLLDNYDSFTWNLHHYLTQLTSEQVHVRRNDEITLEEIQQYQSIILSPGPGLPSQAGIMPLLIKQYCSEIPILGICLGHQAIGEAFDAHLENLDKVLHGVQREVIITDKEDRLFVNLDPKMMTGHYHSWVISRENFPADFNITARDSNGIIMAISHKHYPLSGVQFHPESVMTPMGLRIIENWQNFSS